MDKDMGVRERVDDISKRTSMYYFSLESEGGLARGGDHRGVARGMLELEGPGRWEPAYYRQESGTCAGVGLANIYDRDECEAIAAAGLGNVAWTAGGSQFADVVDGCSARTIEGGWHVFTNAAGKCERGSSAPSWIPELNGHADCLCSAFQPCICRGALE